MKIFCRQLLFLLLLTGIAQAQNSTSAIAPLEYSGHSAFRLSDGKTEAIIVPALGRVMSFQRVGGENWLWSAPQQLAAGQIEKIPDGGWKNWGGDKTWLAPQSRWNELGGKSSWPPPPEWEQVAFASQVLADNKLKIWGTVSPTTGLRISRVFYHDPSGEFVVEQTVYKTHGAAVRASIWDVAQIDGAKMRAVFLPRAAQSRYENGFRWLSKNRNVTPQTISPTLLQVAPGMNGSYKIGTDTPRSALAAMRSDWALVLKSARPDGIYPEGDDESSGTPVQFFGTGNPKLNYVELELLSPILTFYKGTRWTHSVRWSLHQLPSADANDDAVYAAIDRALD